MKKSTINIVWLKRDLRLSDHQPLKRASELDLLCVLVYLYEPSLIDDSHYDDRHWGFVWESLEVIRMELESNQLKLLVALEEVEPFFKNAAEHYDIQTVFSHKETGIDLTYQRDIRMAALFNELGIGWSESPTNDVQRGLMHRDGWKKSGMRSWGDLWQIRILTSLNSLRFLTRSWIQSKQIFRIVSNNGTKSFSRVGSSRPGNYLKALFMSVVRLQ